MAANRQKKLSKFYVGLENYKSAEKIQRISRNFIFAKQAEKRQTILFWVKTIPLFLSFMLLFAF